MSLAELAARARVAGRVGVDTEFMGEGRYRALLCLVQIGIPVNGRSEVSVLDNLDDTADFGPLADLLADPAVEVVVHAGRQDIALLRRRCETEVRSVFDTQIAAGFAGLRAQASYETLLHDVLGVRVSKSASFTRWDRRPLSDEQERYAREDVEHLLELAGDLQRRLSACGRLDWAREECRALEESSDQRDPDAVFGRLPRIAGLDPTARAVARELVGWRERTAADEDRPVSSVLSDSVLVEVARRRPASAQQLEQIRGVHAGSIRRRGAELLQVVRAGLARDPLPSASGGHRRQVPDDAPLVALSEALLRTRAREADLAYELIATRAELQEVVSAVRNDDPEPAVRTLQGWRRELVGAELQELLAGRRSLSVGANHRLRIEG